ncbi:MAG: hypothetical protein IJL30_04840 [Clostridia bacterium]|nr:hypothetical protein [Clostridia bacterium]
MGFGPERVSALSKVSSGEFAVEIAKSIALSGQYASKATQTSNPSSCARIK